MKFCVVRNGSTLRPLSDDDSVAVHSIPEDEAVLLTYRRSRNPQFHRLIMKLSRLILDNMPESSVWKFEEPLDFIKAVMWVNKIVDFKMNLDGTLRAEPKHINFEDMDETEFRQVANCVFADGAEMLGVSEVELRQAFLEFSGERL